MNYKRAISATIDDKLIDDLDEFMNKHTGTFRTKSHFIEVSMRKELDYQKQKLGG